MKLILVVSFCFACSLLNANDTIFVKVHFLYGSKPKKQYKDVENKWFGGVLGGHVGVEIGDDSILNFVPNGRFHVFGKRKDPHSRYALHSESAFYSILGGSPVEVKKAIVYIPVTASQRQQLDSLSKAYLLQTPYDYALIGMRCGAATYDVLAQVDILKMYSTNKTAIKIFYPKKLRRRLFRLAIRQGWKIERVEGSTRRRWERD